MVQRQNVAGAPRCAGERDSDAGFHPITKGILEIGRAFGVEGLERFVRTQAMAMAEVLDIEAVGCLKNLVESARSGLDPARQARVNAAR